MSRFTFKRKERIRKSSEFRLIYQKGNIKGSLHFKIAILANDLQWSRLGLTISKKIGNAVKRNYIKRRLREYFRLHKECLSGSFDIIVTAKSGAAKLKSADIYRELNVTLQHYMVKP